jgi:ubiquinone/menaquinone biosynthesis C-methylase UbiE
MTELRNIDLKTVEGFGEEWAAFDQVGLEESEHRELFEGYFRPFPLDELSEAEGFDLGCGSGRWAVLVAPRVGKLHCIDPAEKALEVAKRRLAGLSNVEFHLAGVDDMPIGDGTQDFGYSLGVLHHIPDTQAAMDTCVRKLKPGAPFLVYLYYNFDNRPAWFNLLWRVSEPFRAGISRLPFAVRRAVTTAIAAVVYYPLARMAGIAERRGRNVDAWPLSAYRRRSFYVMKTDALDRFGTRLEQRFSREEIRTMMIKAGLTDIVFSDWGNWVACGRKK